jgi:hypothetical protein
MRCLDEKHRFFRLFQVSYQIWGFDKMSIGDENLAGASFVVIDRLIGLIVQWEEMALCKIFV